MWWIVLGAKGILGQDVVELLQSKNQEVQSLGRPQVDLALFDSLRSQVRDADVVVNCAAFTAVDVAGEQERQAFDVNAKVVQYLAVQCREIGVCLVHVSTGYVFDEPADCGASCPEDVLPAPVGAYGRTKLAGEWALQAQGKDYLIVRTAWLYGARGNCSPKTMARLVGEHNRLTVVADQLDQPTWTRGLTDLIWCLVEARAPMRIYHGTSSGKTSWYGFTQETVRSLGRNPAMVVPVVTADFSRPAPRPAFLVLGHRTLETIGVAPIGQWDSRWKVATGEVLADSR